MTFTQWPETQADVKNQEKWLISYSAIQKNGEAARNNG